MKNWCHSEFLLEVLSASFINNAIIRYAIDTSHSVVAYQFLKNSVVHKFNKYIIKAETALTINTGFITPQCCIPMLQEVLDKSSHCSQCLLSEWICSHVFHTALICFSCPPFSSKHCYVSCFFINCLSHCSIFSFQLKQRHTISHAKDTLWWVDLTWSPGALYRYYTISVLSKIEDRKYKSMGQDKDRETTQQLPKEENRFHLGKINLIYCQ